MTDTEFQVLRTIDEIIIVGVIAVAYLSGYLTCLFIDLISDGQKESRSSGRGCSCSTDFNPDENPISKTLFQEKKQ